MTSDLDSAAVDGERAHGEVHADGVLLRLGEQAALEALHQAGLAHVGVPDEDDLEEEVEGVVLRILSLHASALLCVSVRSLLPPLPGHTGETAACTDALWVM